MSLKMNFKSLWTITLVLYIICSTAFSYGDMKNLNSITLYLFLGVSVINIISIGRIKMTIGMLSVILYAYVLLLASVYTPTKTEDVNEILYNFVTMTVLAFCITQYISTAEDLNTIIQAYMFAGLALAIYVYSLYGSTFWNEMMNMTNHANSTVDRLGGDLTNENMISMYTVISSVIAVYNIIINKQMSKIKKLLNVAIAVFCFMVSMASASRKSVILVVICLLAIWLYTSIGHIDVRKWARNGLLAILGIWLLLYLINTLPIFSGVAKRFETLLSFMNGGIGDISEIGRDNMIQTGLRVWWENLFLGAGTGASIYYFGVYSHNNFIEILMNTGIVGLLVFYFAYPRTIYQYLKNVTYYRQNATATILLFALFISVTVCGVGQVYYYNRYYMYLLIVIFAVPDVMKSHMRLSKSKGEILCNTGI